MTQPIARTKAEAGHSNPSWDYKVKMQIEGKEITGYFKSYNKSWGYSAIHTRCPTSDDALYRLVDRPEAYMIDVHTLDMPSEHTQLVHWQFCFSITVRAGSQQIHNSLVSEDLEAMNGLCK